MQPIFNDNLPRRLRNFTIVLGTVLLFVYGFLPIFNNSFETLTRMSTYLDDNGIDPTRYFYTDVEQVAEAEDYLDSALKDN